MAETVWQERGTQRPRDVPRAPETHGCKHRRHPERILHAFNEIVPVLSWLPDLCQEAALATLAPLRLRHRAGAARPVLGVASGSSSSIRYHPLYRPGLLGGCGPAPAGSDRGTTTTRERGASSAPKRGYSPRR